MAGVKGRSGRRSTSDEEKRRKIIDKAWDIINEFFNSDANLRLKASTAGRLVLKDMPSDGESVIQKVVMMPTIMRNGKPLEFNIGTPADRIDEE